jgi:cysteine synthase B
MCWSPQPSTPLHGIEEPNTCRPADVPGIYDASIANGDLTIETEACHHPVRRLGREAGLLVGISAASNITAVRTIGEQLSSRSATGDCYDRLRRRHQIYK